MTDIVERLREAPCGNSCRFSVAHEAADEIERLRAALVHSLGVMLNEEASRHGKPPAEWSRTCGMGFITEALGIEPTLEAARAAINGKEG